MTEALPEYLTLQEVARLGRRNYETVRRAAVEYQRSRGKSGLKTMQRVPRGKHVVRPDDAHRWIRGEAPAAPDRPARHSRAAVA